jgi:hypothetical protein
VFVVGHLGDWRRAAAVLFERESLSGHPAPSREAGAGVAGSVACGVDGGGEVSPALTVSRTATGRLDPNGQTFVAHALRGEGFDASEDGTGRGTPIVPVAFSCKDYGADAGEVSPTLRSMNHDGSHANAGGQVAVAFAENQRGEAVTSDTMGSLKSGGGGKPGQGYPAVLGTFQQNSMDGKGSLGWNEDGEAPLRPVKPQADHQFLVSSMSVRRLTPRECERLQGFPEVQKSYNILICRDLSDQQKRNALAALQSRKLPSNAWLADGGEWRLSAEAAGHHSNTSHQSHAPRVAVDVLIDLERRAVRLHSAGRLFSPASNVGEKSESPLSTGTDSFAHLVALLTRVWERTTPAGKAGSQPSTKPSSHLLSGRDIAISYGHEIEERANDATSAIERATRLFTSTTLPFGQDTESWDSTLTTLCSCALHAIAGCIPEATARANCFAVRLTTSHGYTAIPYRNKPAEGCPDGPRYKALGNSMAVPCMRWIGQRMELVAAPGAKVAA